MMMMTMASLPRHVHLVHLVFRMGVMVVIFVMILVSGSSFLSVMNTFLDDNNNSNNHYYHDNSISHFLHDSMDMGDSPQPNGDQDHDDDGTTNHFHDRLFDGSIAPWRLCVISFLCWMITSSAVAAGIGGGGLLVPLYAMGLGRHNGDDGSNNSSSPKLAIPISAATILGVALGNAAFLVTNQRHPRANRPLIDYATVSLMQPGELVGVVGGVLLNRILPDVILVVLLVLVLGLTAYKTLEKGYSRWQTESRTISSLTGVQGPTIEQNGHQVLLVVSEEGSDDETQTSGNETEMTTSYTLNADEGPMTEIDHDHHPDPLEDEFDVDRSASLSKIEDNEARQYPITIYLALMAMTTFLLVYSLLLNGILIPGFNNCSPFLYWPAYGSPMLVFGTILWYFARRNMEAYRTKVELGFHFVDGDVHWTFQAVRLLVPAAISAGVLAGMLGIGGGMILGPLFVALNFEVSV
jgi:uncharacterized membrane protein YfcA